MLTVEEINILKNNGYTFEEIESIKKGVQNMNEGKTISEEKFWNKVYNKINSKMKENV